LPSTTNNSARAWAKRLTRAGFDCDAVGSVAEAIEALRTKEYDVLLADIHVPGNAGLELIESDPVVSAGLPVILLTGQAQTQARQRNHPAGRGRSRGAKEHSVPARTARLQGGGCRQWHL
jgi:DNA-binding NtrC family response regulator